MYAAHAMSTIAKTYEGGELFYIDFECNDYMEEWNFENWGVKYWSKTDEFLKYVEGKG